MKRKRKAIQEQHYNNIKIIFDFFYKDIELSKELKEKLKVELYNTYKHITSKNNYNIKKRSKKLCNKYL